MGTFGRVISFLNLFSLLFILLFPIVLNGVFSAVFAGSALLIIFLPIILGLINSIRFYIRKNKGLVTASKLDNVLATLPIINISIIVLFIIALFLLPLCY